MTKKEVKKEEVQKKAGSTDRNLTEALVEDKSREIANFVSDIPHTIVTFFNPEWEKGTEEDCWYAILPLEDLPVVVRTPYTGYTPMGKLKDLAMSMLAKPSGVEKNAITEYPSLADPSIVKIIAIPVPIYRMS